MGRIRNIELAKLVAASPIIASGDRERRPVVLVIEGDRTLGPAVDELCGFLGFRTEGVGDALAIGDALRCWAPIGVLATAGAIDCPIYDLLMAVAGFDSELPILLVTDDGAMIRGAVHSAKRLWQLGGLIHLTRGLDTNDVVEFLFHAARRSGTGRLMSV